jgi:hypothetical protein
MNSHQQLSQDGNKSSTMQDGETLQNYPKTLINDK